MYIAAPPNGAPLARDTVHVSVPGVLIVPGKHTRPERVELPDRRGIANTVAAAVLVAMAFPASVALFPSMRESGTTPDAVLVTCMATCATTPLATVFMLVPVSRHIVEPAFAVHVIAFPAATAAGPAVKLIRATLDEL
jgi:hypothetical protein